ncbi:hypothetical protein CI102_10788 [Trichoderma harzianum]|nr:hypothetical protein CI102_10788 [Trichoderma harzianum]
MFPPTPLFNKQHSSPTTASSILNTYWCPSICHCLAIPFSTAVYCFASQNSLRASTRSPDQTTRSKLSNGEKDCVRLLIGCSCCVAAVKDAILLIELSGSVAINSLLLARLSKWLLHFKARGESSNREACRGLIAILSLELAPLSALLLVAIFFFAIRICILVIFVCSRKKQWTWNEYHASFKQYSKIDYIENCFEKFKEWCGRQWWGKALFPREENSSTTNETDSQGV